MMKKMMGAAASMGKGGMGKAKATRPAAGAMGAAKANPKAAKGMATAATARAGGMGKAKKGTY